MVTVERQPLASKWGKLDSAKWSEAAGTWKVNGYSSLWVVNVSDGIALNESHHKAVTANENIPIHVVSSYADNIKYHIRVLERFSITPKLSKHRYEKFTESVLIADSSNSSVALKINTLLRMLEAVSDLRTMSRNIREQVIFSESVSKHLESYSKSLVSIHDELLENSRAVISDIIISDNEIDVDIPAGYEPWQPFVSGDYTYKDALLKCRVSAMNTEGRTLLSSYKVFVDLPDIQDHAVTKVEAEKTWIPFELEFYQIPEVTITMTGSTGKVIIPNILEVNTKGFYVELRDTSNVLCAGIISWQALGC